MDCRFFCFENSHRSLERSHWIKISFSSTAIFVKPFSRKVDTTLNDKMSRLLFKKIGIAVNCYLDWFSMIFPIEKIISALLTVKFGSNPIDGIIEKFWKNSLISTFWDWLLSIVYPSQCLKITKNVAFEVLVLLKLNCLLTQDRKR